MKSYSNNATSYYLWNENIEARDDFTFTDKDFIAMLKTYDEVVILDDHYTFNALTKKLFGRTYAPGVYKTSDILAGKGWYFPFYQAFDLSKTLNYVTII